MFVLGITSLFLSLSRVDSVVAGPDAHVLDTGHPPDVVQVGDHVVHSRVVGARQEVGEEVHHHQALLLSLERKKYIK